MNWYVNYTMDWEFEYIYIETYEEHTAHWL